MAADGIVLVTGGSRGIGAATARLLAGQGRRVVIVDLAPEPLAGTQAILWPAPFDVASENAVVSGIADIEAAHGPITGLVNAAGVFGKMHRIERVRMDQWEGLILLRSMPIKQGVSQGSGSGSAWNSTGIPRIQGGRPCQLWRAARGPC